MKTKTRTPIVAFALVTLLASPIFAQATGQKTKGTPGGEKFFDFQGLVIDGELRKPGSFFTTAREKVKFDRLLRLRRSFLEETLESAQDPALKAR